MNCRFVLPWLVLLGLLVAPFGRMAAAEAMARPHPAPAAMAGHCDEIPAPHHDKGDRSNDKAIDCLSACAAMAALECPVLPGLARVACPQVALISVLSAGLDPQADPPPPRLS